MYYTSPLFADRAIMFNTHISVILNIRTILQHIPQEHIGASSSNLDKEEEGISC
jgi:hypothetical protein